MRRRVVAILNPVSGRRDMRPVAERIGRFVERRGASFELLETSHSGHATQLASQAAAQADAVLVVGGDGTVCEVVNGLCDSEIPVAILPTGTENLLARYLKMPREPEKVADLLNRGARLSYDVGVLNGRRFLVVAGAGFDAECVHRLSRVRRGHITHLHYAGPILRAFWSYGFSPISVVVDGAVVFDGRGFAIVGNTPAYSVGMRVVPDARPDDGKLDVAIFPCRGKSQLLMHAYRVFRCRHVGRGGVRHHQGRRIRIEAPDPVPVEIDGDMGGFTPADCSILPGAASFLRFD